MVSIPNPKLPPSAPEMEESYASTGVLPLGLATRLGGASSTLNLPAPRVLLALAPQNIAWEFLDVLGECGGPLHLTLPIYGCWAKGTETFAAIEKFAGVKVDDETLDHPHNALNLQIDAHKTMGRHLGWGIKAIPSSNDQRITTMIDRASPEIYG
ncbi:hypothetical protein H0H92_012220 [Tricholoma furcatifolium]|nr:hypothetical protein H0H92_012220 [Tricholoma furcatifolium]